MNAPGPNRQTSLRDRIDAAVPPHMRPRAVMLAAALTLAAFMVMHVGRPLLGAFDHWTADLRTAFFTYQLDGPHPSVALVYINEDAIAEAQKDGPSYRSPVDRGLLARIVDRLDQLRAKAIGLDIIVDQASEAAKDEALLASLKRAKAQVVMARLDLGEGRAVATSAQAEYHAKFLKQVEAAGKRTGYVTVKSDLDGVVRTQPGKGSENYATFSEEIAKVGGWLESSRRRFLTMPSDRIAWLRQPADNSTTFVTVPALLLLKPDGKLTDFERQTLSDLAGRSVIVGVRFVDDTDRHKTPLASSGGDSTLGAEINAHVVAQLVDRRSYLALTRTGETVLFFLTALLGVIVAWRWPDSVGLVGSLLYAVFIVMSGMIFWAYKVILPFAAPSLIWGAAVLVGWLQSQRTIAKSTVATGRVP